MKKRVLVTGDRVKSRRLPGEGIVRKCEDLCVNVLWDWGESTWDLRTGLMYIPTIRESV